MYKKRPLSRWDMLPHILPQANNKKAPPEAGPSCLQATVNRHSQLDRLIEEFLEYLVLRRKYRLTGPCSEARLDSKSCSLSASIPKSLEALSGVSCDLTVQHRDHIIPPGEVKLPQQARVIVRVAKVPLLVHLLKAVLRALLSLLALWRILRQAVPVCDCLREPLLPLLILRVKQLGDIQVSAHMSLGSFYGSTRPQAVKLHRERMRQAGCLTLARWKPEADSIIPL